MVAALCAGSVALVGQTPTFRASTDLVAVGVQVVGRDGVPIQTLASKDFQVWINGHVRRVISADLVKYPLTPSATAADTVPSMASAASAAVITPKNVTGRMIVLVVDESSLSPASARMAAQAARKFVMDLPAEDVVGLYTFPFGRATVDLEHDHAKVAASLDRISGRYQAPPGRFGLSLADIMDITAESNTPRSTETNRIAARECDPTDIACPKSIIGEAQTKAALIEMQSTQSLGELRFLIRGLGALPGRKTVVLISGGLASSDRMGARPDVSSQLKSAGQEASAVDAVLYALHVDTSLTDAFSASQKPTLSGSDRMESVPRDRLAQASGLERLAGEAGGAVFRDQVGAGEVGLARVLRETSAYYLLGVETTATDRDGRIHAIRVKANAKSATVRSRSQVLIPVTRQKAPN